MALETWVQSQVKSNQRLKKWLLMPPCFTLSIIRYGSRVSGAIQGSRSTLPYTSVFVVIEKESIGRSWLWSANTIYMIILLVFYLFIYLYFISIHIPSPQPSGIFFHPSPQPNEIFFHLLPWLSLIFFYITFPKLSGVFFYLPPQSITILFYIDVVWFGFFV